MGGLAGGLFGGGSSSTSPVIPDFLQDMYRSAGSAIQSGIKENPLSDYYEMDPQQFAGLSDSEKRAMGAAGGLYAPSQSSEDAKVLARSLGQYGTWNGVDLSQVGAPAGDIPPSPRDVSDWGRAAPDAAQVRQAAVAAGKLLPTTVSEDGSSSSASGWQRAGGSDPTIDPDSTTAPATGTVPGSGGGGGAGGGGSQPGVYDGWQPAGQAHQRASSASAPRIGRWDQNFGAAMDDNAAIQATKDNLQANILPEVQSNMAAMGLARSGASGTATANAIAAALVPVTQSVMQAELQNKNMDVGQRSTDIGAALSQGQQALAARGQNIGAQEAAMSGLAGIDARDLNRTISAINADTSLGGRERSIADSKYGAEYAELMRRFGLSHDYVFAPLTGVSNTIGSRTESGK